MRIRLVLQPIMAGALAVRSGLRDVREGRTPYLEALLREPAQRRQILLEGWRDAGKVLLVAVALDLAYQGLVLREFRPGEAVIVAATLAILPYVAVRGFLNRILRRVRPRLDGARPPR